jgi:hypothetical protein
MITNAVTLELQQMWMGSSGVGVSGALEVKISSSLFLLEEGRAFLLGCYSEMVTVNRLTHTIFAYVVVS